MAVTMTPSEETIRNLKQISHDWNVALKGTANGWELVLNDQQGAGSAFRYVGDLEAVISRAHAGEKGDGFNAPIPVKTRWLREWTSSGPCFPRGQIVRETAQFYVLSGPDSCTNHKEGEHKVKKSSSSGFHVEPCDRCRMEYGN